MKNDGKNKKIVLLPLDERPCNYDYPQMMPTVRNCKVVLPPKDLLGDKKQPADTKLLADWLLRETADADACILSLDMLLYGGIVPSRLHRLSQDELTQRARVVEELRANNANMKIYAFQLIMRCPDYSLSDEEPEYYDLCGRELHLYGRYTHLFQLGRLSQSEAEDFESVKKKIKPEYLHDFTERRKKNLAALMHNLSYVRDGVVDYFIVPQDDSAVYGFTALDQMRVREYLKANTLHSKTAMYPSADDTGLTLLARAAAELSGVQPKVYVHYASHKGGNVIPLYEDRIIDETIKYHILSVGGVRVYSLAETDILLAVNIGSHMCDITDSEYVNAYDVERNPAEFVSYIKYALGCGKIVSVADVAKCNGGDEELISLMQSEKLLFAVHGYAGWNTSSNTIGTTLCQGVLNYIGVDIGRNISFLVHRYYEDIGYMAYTRNHVTQTVLPALGLDYFHADGKTGKVAAAVKDAITQYMNANYPAVAERVESIRVEMPWRRMFETDVKIVCKERGSES